MSDAAAVLIESLIKRPGGSKIPMGSVTYHFAPDDLGRHVATVSDTGHIARFLQITEGFRLLGAVTAPTAPAAPPAPPVGVVSTQGTSLQPAQLTGPADAVTAPAAPAPSVQEQQDANTTEKPLAEMSDEELRATFKAEIGRAPSPKSKPETMIAQIEAIRAERGAAQ